MADLKVVKRKLPSGLRLLMIPREEIETVAFMVMVGVGSRYETLKQAGLSHFLEHMFFKGTEKRSDKKEIAEVLDGVGAYYNAFTADECTGYYVKCARENLELATDVVADILLRSLFSEKEIETEKGVVMEEINMYTENPMRHIEHMWRKALYGSHPLGRRIDGTVETVRGFSRKDLVDYAKKNYQADNVVVVVAGNFNEEEVEKLTKDLFADIARSKAKQPRKAPLKLPASKIVNERRAKLEQTHVIVGVPGVGLNDERRWAAELLAVILGGGMSSRLFMEVRENYGLAYAIGTSSDNYIDTGTLHTQAGLRTDKAKFAVQLIMDEYDKIMNEKVSVKELDKVKKYVHGRMVLDLEESSSIALFVGSQELLQEKTFAPSEIWGKLQAVTADDIQSLAQELLEKKKRSLALLGPQRSVAAFEKLLD